MPLDNASFIKDLNPNNPVGTIDKISILDDVAREIKRAVVNTFPNMDGQVVYSTTELNDIRTNLTHSPGLWDMKNNVLKNVKAIDDDAAVEPRAYNDTRYLMASKNLSDLPNKGTALSTLLTAYDPRGESARLLRLIVNNIVWPIGSVFINGASDVNPVTTLGIGTWVRYGEGRAIVGAGTLNDGRESRTFANGNTGGEFTHTLSIAEMPAHSHNFEYLAIQKPGPDTKHNFDIAQQGRANYTTASTGGSQAHNNMQPYVVASAWIRTA